MCPAGANWCADTHAAATTGKIVSMSELPPSLVELAHRFGVATGFNDWTGTFRSTPETTLVAVLAALGVTADSEADRAAALSAHDQQYWQRTVAPTIVTRDDRASSFWVHVTHGQPVEVWIALEDGTVRTGLRQLENLTPPHDLDGRQVGEATFELPAGLPLGYHRLHVRADSREASTMLIVVPAATPLPAALGAGRTWGLATQLYSVRSERSWGIGRSD